MPVLRTPIAVLAMIASLALTPAAFAATDNTSISLLAGTLDYTTPLVADDFPATTLTGLPQAARPSTPGS